MTEFSDAAQAAGTNMWFARVLGAEMGPMPYDDLKAMVARGELAADDDVRPAEWDDWVRARDVVGLIPLGVHRGSTWTLPPKAAPGNAASVVASPAVGDNNSPHVPEPSPEWFCEVLGTELGPMSFDNLFAMAQHGELSATDRVRFGTWGEWQPAGQIAGLMPEGKSPEPDAGTQPRPVFALPVPPAVGLQDQPEWFCRILGSEFGPLSLADLLEMIRVGEVSRDDAVRCGRSGAWTPADTLPQLRDAFPPATPREAASRAAEAAEEPTAAPALSPPASPLAPAAVAETPPTSAPPTSAAPPAVAVAAPTVPAAAEAPAAMVAAAAVPSVPAEVVSAPRAGAAPIQAAPSASVSGFPPVPPISTASAPLPQYLPTGKSAAPVYRSGSSLNEWLQEHLGNPKLLVIPVVMLAAIGVVALLRAAGDPKQQYQVLESVYAEHQQLRKEKAAPRRWKELEERSVPQLEPIIRDLQKHASSDDRLRQHLLWAGRDYLPVILKEARHEEHRAETRFREHMEKAARLLAGEKPPPPVRDEREDAPLNVEGEGR